MKNEVPVGAVIILDSKIIGRGHNQPILKNDSTSCFFGLLSTAFL